jgi:hypothetical protein
MQISLENAKEYVVGYYAKGYTMDGVQVTPDVIGAGVCHKDGVDMCLLNVVIEPSGELHQWECWVEDLGDGPFVYGEF